MVREAEEQLDGFAEVAREFDDASEKLGATAAAFRVIVGLDPEHRKGSPFEGGAIPTWRKGRPP